MDTLKGKQIICHEGVCGICGVAWAEGEPVQERMGGGRFPSCRCRKHQMAKAGIYKDYVNICQSVG